MFCLIIINSLGIKSCDSSFNDFKLNQHQNTSGEVEKLGPTNTKIGGREETTEEAMHINTTENTRGSSARNLLDK